MVATAMMGGMIIEVGVYTMKIVAVLITAIASLILFQRHIKPIKQMIQPIPIAYEI